MTSKPDSPNSAKGASSPGGKSKTDSTTPKFISLNGQVYSESEMRLLPPGKVTEILLYTLIVKLETIKEQGEEMIYLGKKMVSDMN